MRRIWLQGPVVPYVRMTRRGKWVARDAQRYLASQMALKIQLRQAWEGPPLDRAPIAVGMRFEGVGHGCDLDNLAKAVLDAMTGIVFADDRWVDRLTVQRLAGARPQRIRLEVGLLED